MRCCAVYACCKHHGYQQEVREKEVELQSGDVLPYGLCVWSTGVGTQLLSAFRSAATVMHMQCLAVCPWLSQPCASYQPPSSAWQCPHVGMLGCFAPSRKLFTDFKRNGV
jgi:hypothetical protein